MCGITGFITSEVADRSANNALLNSMCAAIAYRGPDEQGTFVEGRAALGMRRLSIIDVKGGQQPISNDDDSKLIVFNGEIYNYPELRKDLTDRGYRFKTNSDTETILRAYEEFGAGCVPRLRGMFAFAIWDTKDESLFIARDRVGKKPLFYSHTPGGNFVFGSELKTLLIHGEVSREIDYGALDAYLAFGYVPEEFCIFRAASKLQPGHYLLFRDGKVETTKYWDFDYSESSEIRSEEEYAEALQEKIRDAVKVRLISEVPLGAFLSGGIDSSSVVGMMSQLLETPVKTFSIGFDEDSFGELKFARIAAKHFNTEHHEFTVTSDQMDIVDELVWHLDEPHSDSSALPTYMVSKLARDYVTVVLTGDGGDELFAGYERYVIDRQRSGLDYLPKVLRRRVLEPMSRALPRSVRGKYFLYNASLDASGRYIDKFSQFNALQRAELYSSDFYSKLNGDFGCGESVFRKLAANVSTGQQLDRLLYLDSKTYLVADIMTKVDRMSMAASLEARAPLLDHELIEFVVKMPASLKLKGVETKYIFKRAMDGVVPREILNRRKQGFGMPISDWVNTQLRDRIHSELSESRTMSRGYFDPRYVRTLLDEHRQNRRDHSPALWLLWMLELWHRRFVDR